MFGIGAPELIFIMVIMLFLFGVKKLPEIGSGLGNGIRNFKKGVSGSKASLSEKLPEKIG